MAVSDVPPLPRPAEAASLRVKYFTQDDSLFLDDAYVIKGVPGRLLFHFLKAYIDEGRREFTTGESVSTARCGYRISRTTLRRA